MRSGISDYAVDLLPHLAEVLAARGAEVRLVHASGPPPEIAFDPELPQIEGAALEVASGEADRIPVFHMGNNHHHREIWRLAMERPGVLVLHDLVLHHFLIERTVAAEDFDGYRRQLTADHGWIGEAAALPMRWPGGAGNAAQFALPAHRHLLARQRGVIVHSHWAAERLHEEMPSLAPDGAGALSDRVRVVPMGVPLPPAATDGSATRSDALPAMERDPERAAFRRRRGLPLDHPILGVFGFQTPMKRTEVVVRALAHPALAEVEKPVHLMVAGEAAAILDLESVAEELGVADRVHVLGYLPYDEFEAAIAAVDVCCNLRYPTAGETSASLLRILAVGRPAIVSDHAQNAELPDDGLLKVPVGEGEVEALVAGLSQWLASPDALAAAGRAAREFVARAHRPEDAAEALARAVSELAALPLPAEAAGSEATSVEPTSLAWDRLGGRLEVAGHQTPWPPGERRVLRVTFTNDGPARWLAAERPAGGVAVEARLWHGDTDLWRDHGWIGLPFDLEPGASHTFELPLRRPLGEAVTLELVPHVLDHTGFADLGGSNWRAAL